MDSTIKVKVNNLKNIKTATIEMPLEKSINLIVGNNGSGKSTMLLAISQAISKYNLERLNMYDFDDTSFVEIDINSNIDRYNGIERWQVPRQKNTLNGMYEGSLFYGTRFYDSRKVDDALKQGKIKSSDIVDADEYVKEKVSYILQGIPGKYPNLKRIKNRDVWDRLGFQNAPYFNEINGHLISQYRMSSGECLLISLMHFLYNSIVRRSLPRDIFILVLVDEIEFALHPIAVSRFIDFINEVIASSNNLMVILTSHSPEVIQKIPPKNIYKMENYDGNAKFINPGFPSYIIRDVYRHDGYDFLFLTEDELAKALLDKVIDTHHLRDSKLIHTVPVGGWENVLKLQRDLLSSNVLGVGKTITSIIDGDVKDVIPDQYRDLRKLFLPLASIEKYLYEKLVTHPDHAIKKMINDKYFTINSIDSLIAEHSKRYPGTTENPDKKFYFRLVKDLQSRRIDEMIFINNLAIDLLSLIDFTRFIESLKRIVSA